MSEQGSSTTKIEAETLRRTPEQIATTRREVAISQRTGMLVPQDLAQALELSQSMAKGEEAVPKHLRGSPGACLAIIEYANSWEMAPYGVANETYVVNDRLSFQGKLIHAVIKKRAPLKYPNMGLDCEYLGEGQERRCVVSAEVWIDDEHTATKVLKWDSPMLKDIKPQNSPLWKSDPDQQLFYRTSQRWQRRYFPEILLGIYSKEEMEDVSDEDRAAMARDVTPQTPAGTGLAARLTGNHGEGFRAENIQALDGNTGTADELAKVAPDVPEGQQPAEPTQADSPKAAAPPVDPAGGTDPKPNAKPKEKKEPKPKTAAEYIEYFKAWLPTIDNEPEIVKRFGDEKTLRTSCGVMGEDLDTVLVSKNARLTEIRNQ